jgi:putative phosphoribosyl transferase
MADLAIATAGDDGVYESRADAGRVLGERLGREHLRHVVVVGIARAGVEVAAEVARVLGAPLEVMCVRKILHPLAYSTVLGAVTADGGVCLRDRGGLTDAELTMAAEEARAEALLLDRRFREVAGGRPERAPGWTAVVVDDGLETGSSMTAAIHSVRAAGASSAVAAVPVGTTAGVASLSGEADVVVCVNTVDELASRPARYHVYPQVSEEAILSLLARRQAG